MRGVIGAVSVFGLSLGILCGYLYATGANNTYSWFETHPAQTPVSFARLSGTVISVNAADGTMTVQTVSPYANSSLRDIRLTYDSSTAVTFPQNVTSTHAAPSSDIKDFPPGSHIFALLARQQGVLRAKFIFNVPL